MTERSTMSSPRSERGAAGRPLPVRPPLRVALRIGALLLAALTGSGALGAQAAPPPPPAPPPPAAPPDASQDTPAIALQGIAPVRTVDQWPGVALSVNRDVYVAVFALTRGRQDFPVQVLAPASPGDRRMLRAGTRVRMRPLERQDLLHLVTNGDAPLLVAFAAAVPPDLRAFADGRRWGHELVLDTMVVDQRALVAELGRTLFPPGTAYDVVTTSTSLPIPVTRTASHWAFTEECLGYTNRFVNRLGEYALAGGGGYGSLRPVLGEVDPLLLTSVGGVGGRFLPVLPMGPISLWGGGAGGRVEVVAMPYGIGTGCRGYRVVWFPQLAPPPMTAAMGPADSLLSPADGGMRPDTLRLRPPRFPGGDGGMSLDTAWTRRAGPVSGRDSVGLNAGSPAAWRRGDVIGGRRTADLSPDGAPGVLSRPRGLPDDAVNGRGTGSGGRSVPEGGTGTGAGEPGRGRPREEDPPARSPGGLGDADHRGGGSAIPVERERRPVDPPSPPPPPPPPRRSPRPR